MYQGSYQQRREPSFYRKSLQISLFDFVHGFLLFLKAFILYTSYNIWHYVEAKSLEGGMILSRSPSSILSIEENPLGTWYSD